MFLLLKCMEIIFTTEWQLPLRSCHFYKYEVIFRDVYFMDMPAKVLLLCHCSFIICP